MSDKKDLLTRLFNPQSHKCLVVPIDYGVYKGPITEVEQIDQVLPILSRYHVNAVLLHKGLIKHYSSMLSKNSLNYFMHISASTGLGNPLRKVLVGSVEEAKNLGAIGVSMLVYLGNEYESEMLKMLGEVSLQADKQGLLLYAMMYVADHKKIQGKTKFVENTDIHAVKWAARVGFELGVDILEVRYPKQITQLSEIVKVCPIPVLIADSAKFSNDEFTTLLKKVSNETISGVSLSKRVLNVENGKRFLNEANKILNGVKSMEKM